APAGGRRARAAHLGPVRAAPTGRVRIARGRAAPLAMGGHGDVLGVVAVRGRRRRAARPAQGPGVAAHRDGGHGDAHRRRDVRPAAVPCRRGTGGAGRRRSVDRVGLAAVRRAALGCADDARKRGKRSVGCGPVLWFERQLVRSLMTPGLDAADQQRIETYVDTTLRSMPEHLRAGVIGESVLLGAPSVVARVTGRFDPDRPPDRTQTWHTSRIDFVRQYARLLHSLVLFAENELVAEPAVAGA